MQQKPCCDKALCGSFIVASKCRQKLSWDPGSCPSLLITLPLRCADASPLPKLLSIACVFTPRQRRPLGGRGLYRAAHTGHLLAVETARSV